MQDPVEAGTLTAELAERLANYVTNRKNILISAATSSGKTTLANILTETIPDQERIVLIEDTAGIQIQKPNVFRFEARPAEWRARSYNPRPSESNPQAPPRPDNLGRNP